MKYPIRKSTAIYYMSVMSLCCIGVLIGGWVIYLYIVGKESSPAGGIIFSLGACGIFFAMLRSYRQLDQGYSITNSSFIVWDPSGKRVEYPLEELLKCDKGPGYRVLYFGSRKIQVTNYFENHAEMFSMLDSYFEKKVDPVRK